MARRIQRGLGRGLIFLILVAGAFVFLFPFLWMLSTSLKTPQEIVATQTVWIPAHPQWKNYAKALGYFPFVRYLMNTLFLVSMNVVGTLFSSALVGYSFARLRWPGREIWFKVVLFTKDKMIPLSAYNTLYFAIFSVPLNMCVGILIAVMMNQKICGIRILRTIYYLPNVVSIVAVSMLWYFIFQSNGVLNRLLGAIKIQGPNWLSDPAWAKNALILMNCWNAGGSMVIYLAGLQGIPRSYYEAAEVDGAGALRKFFSITLPLLSPSIFYNLIIGIIGALQTFSTALVMTDGGPVNSTTFYVLTLYRRAFEDMRMGYASAMAWVLMVITLLLTLVVFWIGNKKVYYEQ